MSGNDVPATHAKEPVAVVIPALDEEEAVAAVVRGFLAEDAVARVVVVDNGSSDDTAERARVAGAEVLSEPRRGYGRALRTGIEHACSTGAATVVLAEADGTFDARETGRLLAALDEAELVLGSRAAHLGGALRAGNRGVARLLSALWAPRSCPLTDVGCTFRALRRVAWERIASRPSPDGPEFSPWMIGAAFEAGLRVRELPVSYGTRAGGRSKHSASAAAVARTALRMLRAIVAQRLTRS